MKMCKMCSLLKPSTKFTYGKAICKKCRSIKINLEYRNYSPEEKQRIIDEAKNRNRKHKYNITPEQYNEMFAQQHGSCAVCFRHHTDFKKGLHMDHDHSTGKVRALLCPGCNLALGYAKENKKTLRGLIDYLEKHSSIEENVFEFKAKGEGT